MITRGILAAEKRMYNDDFHAQILEFVCFFSLYQSKATKNKPLLLYFYIFIPEMLLLQ